MKMNLGDKIRIARKGKMTQAELADLIGVHETTIRRWELGDRIPDVGMLQKISEVLQVPFSEFIDVGKDYDPAMKMIHDLENYAQEKVKNPTMSYWGGVVDNARTLAKSGNHEDIYDVSQMLKRALASLEPAMQTQMA